MADEIIDFYKKAKEPEEPQKPIEEQKETPVPEIPKPDEPFDRFLLELAEKLQKEKVITEKQQETFVEQIKEPVSTDPNENDPFKKFIGSFANILKEDELVNREENIKEATISFINKLKEQPEEPFIIKDEPVIKAKKQKYLPPKIAKKVQKLPQPLKKEEPVVEEQADDPVKEEPKEENTYVKELKTTDKTNKKIPEKIKSVSDIKSIVEKQVAEILSRYPNLGFTGGGGGTNAVQYAKGGTMDGDLNVTGKFLSGGVDISTLFNTGGGGAVSGIPDRLISGPQSLILNTDGSISFPDGFITAPDGQILNIQSETVSPSSFARISLSPYAFFAYDNEGNSISFDVVDNAIVLTSKDQYEWTFNQQGVLVGPNSHLTVNALSSLGRILSGGKDLSEIFLTSETDAQTLSWIASSYLLSISNGNSVSLASLSSTGGGTGRDDVNTIVISNSANWNTAYNTATIVQANSASWEESSEILPTVTNYLSSSNVLLSALTVTTDISAQGLIYSRSLTPNLPVPKIVLMGPAYGNTTAEYLTGGPGTLGVGGLITLNPTPYVRVLDFTQEDLNNNQIFIEMVIFKKKSKYLSNNVEGFRSYVVPTGNATPPWGNNFWQRSGDQSSSFDNPKLSVTRYNHLSVTALGQTISLINCLNGHFREKEISYLDPTSNDFSDYRTINCIVPSNSKGNVLSTANLNRRKFPYVRTYKPLYIAFRYICWLPNNNNGRGQIISGPLSPTIKVANSIFPFDIDHYQSSLKGFPVCNLNPNFDKTSFTCKFC